MKTIRLLLAFAAIALPATALGALPKTNQCAPYSMSDATDCGRKRSGWLCEKDTGDCHFMLSGVDWLEMDPSGTTLTIVSDQGTLLVWTDNAQFSGTVTVDGALTVTGAQTFTGDLSLGGGAGALTCTSGDCSLVLVDNDQTAFVVGATGALNILQIDTQDATPSVMINGVTTTLALQVVTGNAEFDEDVKIAGGAGALDFTDSGASSVLMIDNDTTALLFGSTGALNILTLDTGDASPSLIVTGVTTTTAFEVATGNALLAEDLSIGGGVGAVTLTHSDSSALLVDNDTTAWDIGSAGRTAAMRFSTANGAESISYEAEVHESPAMIIDFEAGVAANLQLAQSDFTAYDSTAATLNFVQFRDYVLGSMMVVDAGNTVPTVDATGFDMTAGNVTENDHVSYWSNYGPGITGEPFIAESSAAFQFCVDMTVTDVDGTDFHYCGFRTPDPVTVSMASYTDYCALGHISGNYGTHDKVTGATDSGADVIADTEEDTWCILVSAAGVCTYTIDGVAVASADTHDFAAGVLLIPFCELRHDLLGAEDTIIGKWAVTYQ